MKLSEQVLNKTEKNKITPVMKIMEDSMVFNQSKFPILPEAIHSKVEDLTSNYYCSFLYSTLI